jgi:hypothetical protein
MRQGRFLVLQGKNLSVRLNCLRGLALDALIDHRHGDQPLCGTLHHGYYDDIRWGADYYSGHLVLESPGRRKVTDLQPAEPALEAVAGGLCVSVSIPTPLGPVEKRWWIDDAGGRLVLSQRLDWSEPLIGTLRLGHITLIPEAFDITTLGYRTHNGGRTLESFAFAGAEVTHGRAVSFLVSSNQAIGVTGGMVELGDSDHRLRVCHDPAQSALIGLISHHLVRDSHFTRLAFSAREVDDTSRPLPVGNLCLEFEISLSG